MNLAIHALAVQQAPLASHTNLLGTPLPSAYHHLYDEAGKFSRPDSVRRGVTRMYTAEYQAPTSDSARRCADMASSAVGEVLVSSPALADRVDQILHTQCTLDRQILGSTCLRIQHDHFPHAGSSLTIGQLGTAALPTMFRMLKCQASASDRGLCSVSASDQWIAPFYRRIPGIVTYGDVSAACLVGAASDAPVIARINSIRTSYRRMPAGPWNVAPEHVLDGICAAASDCIELLLAEAGKGISRDALLIAGDCYDGNVAERVALKVGIANRVVSASNEVHLSSAALLASVQRVVDVVVSGGEDRHAIVWTSSLSGHAGALLLRIHADAERTAVGWRAASNC